MLIMNKNQFYCHFQIMAFNTSLVFLCISVSCNLLAEDTPKQYNKSAMSQYQSIYWSGSYSYMILFGAVM